jgi:hypothetical protein
VNLDVITDNAWEKLESYATGASCIRAVMAFWTIPAADLPPQLLTGLSRLGGFLCTDLNMPTSIRALQSLHLAGVHARLHLMTTTGKSEIEDSAKKHNHLMHSKVIIFDYDNQESVVWVGSHNGTFRALDGVNYECSVATVSGRQSSLYLDVQAHINKIHSACQPFRPELIDHYRFLQGVKMEDAVGVMEFENGNDKPLSPSDEITVFNMSREDLRSFKTIDTDLILSLHGSREILYSAKVVQTGETPTPRSQTFNDRRYADRHHEQLPVLKGKAQVTTAMYKRGTYFSIVKIVQELDPSNRLLEIPSNSAWVVLPSVELSDCAKVDDDLKSRYLNRTIKPDGLTFKVPAFSEMVNFDLAMSDDIQELRMTAFKEMRLQEKRAIKRPALIKRKLLVKH